MSNTESPTRFVQFDLNVNYWRKNPPNTPEARPPRCPICGAPGQSSDGRIVLHGHGSRVRRLRGPIAADGKPIQFEVLVRRYACQCCKAIVTVGPRGLLPRRRYTGNAIALALWLWAVWQHTDPKVRDATCPVAESGVSRPERWTTLRRWARAGRDGALWSGRPALALEWTLRLCAERVARWLWSFGDPDAPTEEHRIFGAAAHAR